MADRERKLSWREGLFLVGPDPLTSPYYSSGALIVAGVGYATPLFQIGLYGFLFLLAPLYVEAVLLTLSNGGTYVMTRYALSHLGRWAVVVAAAVGVVISFSYVATAIVSLLSYSDYLMSLVQETGAARTPAAILLSSLPSFGFGLWVMPAQWRKTLVVVSATSFAAVVLSTLMPATVVVMLPPLVLLFLLNNYGLRESVRVSRTIFLVNLVVMGVTIVFGVAHVFMFGADLHRFFVGVDLGSVVAASNHEGSARSALIGFSALSAALIPAALGSSILGASGVESVMNIPEELADPRTAVRQIYRWMLSILLVLGGSLCILLFLVLPPEDLLGAASYLLAALGERAVGSVTGVPALGSAWKLFIVANAALMLIGATNTSFAGVRGLWITMARDNLLPRSLLELNERGAFERVHWLMLASIMALCGQASASTTLLERWYGATFGLVMFSGVVAFILLRRFKATDRRVYTATPNITLAGTQVPVAAIVGFCVLGIALAGLYQQYETEIGTLEDLVLGVAVAVGAVLIGYNHRSLLRWGHVYYRRVIETEEETILDTSQHEIVVATGGARVGQLLSNALTVARAQRKATGRPYARMIIFHMSSSVRSEHIYRVQRSSIRPAGIRGNSIRIFTELTQLDAADIEFFLVLVPNPAPEKPMLQAAMQALVEFHERHAFRGHIVMIGDYGVSEAEKAALAEQLQGSTLVPVPVQ